ncbi:hypothetical protein M378DRAFT_155269 [Amanita muscaria Koide BX008]|uniref:Uncharacterized protein n=1 Tax=Amanita muscaria (strain Koide BX008) TaxID=946122 RepID=A0A0C2XB81_AMAMK|nr:hypothetical protein M378DRAFT_155269 [Amanita muscaria Koide BX008]
MSADSSSTTVPPLGKYLASTDKKTRDRAIKQLSNFLSTDASKNTLSKSDLAKLWKGIFYCFWMSDKPLVQQALADELAELLLTISTPSASLFFLRGFWETTVREWNGIDQLRIDKYYMLIRRFVNATFRLLICNGWNSDACEEYSDILTVQGGVLCPSDNRVPTSLSFHLAEIYLEELEKALSASPSSPPAPLLKLLKPFFFLAAKTQHKTTYQRLRSALFEPLFDALSAQSISDAERLSKRVSEYPTLVSNCCLEMPETEGRVDPGDLKKKLLRALFEIASLPDTRDANRRRLYELWKEGGVLDADE